MLDRKTDFDSVRAALKRSRVVALLGPRQCGKTTLARQFVPAAALNYFDLEDPASLARLTAPELALRPLKGLGRFCSILNAVFRIVYSGWPATSCAITPPNHLSIRRMISVFCWLRPGLPPMAIGSARWANWRTVLNMKPNCSC